MADAISKTNSVLRLPQCPLSALVKNADNPNRMSGREFDLLVDNMNKTGWTDPVLARPVDLKKLHKLMSVHVGTEELQKALSSKEWFRIVGGHHRFDAASFLGFEHGPVNVIMDPDFDDDAEAFQLVRMNVIRGRMDPAAFFSMYEKLTPKYNDEVMQDLMGFADEAQFRRLVDQTAKALPTKHAQDKFKEEVAKQEIKTIAGLSTLLNKLFSQYGDTLPYGYMVVDYGGQKSIWLRCSKKTYDSLVAVGDICMDRSRTMDDLVGRVLELMVRPDAKEFMESVIAETPEVKLPEGMQALPTKDHVTNLENAA